MRLVLVGPPGASKSTQATILSEKPGVPHISTGGLFRANIGEGTSPGIEVKSYIDAGNPVPDDATMRTVESRLNEDDAAKGFLLDDFPYTVGQAKELKRPLPNLGTELDVVVQFDVSEDVVVERMLARGCADDTEEVTHSRMHMHTNETVPLLDYYSEKIIKITAEGSVEEINGRTMAELEKLN